MANNTASSSKSFIPLPSNPATPPQRVVAPLPTPGAPTARRSYRLKGTSSCPPSPVIATATSGSASSPESEPLLFKPHPFFLEVAQPQAQRDPSPTPPPARRVRSLPASIWMQEMWCDDEQDVPSASTVARSSATTTAFKPATRPFIDWDGYKPGEPSTSGSNSTPVTTSGTSSASSIGAYTQPEGHASVNDHRASYLPWGALDPVAVDYLTVRTQKLLDEKDDDECDSTIRFSVSASTSQSSTRTVMAPKPRPYIAWPEDQLLTSVPTETTTGIPAPPSPITVPLNGLFSRYEHFNPATSADEDAKEPLLQSTSDIGTSGSGEASLSASSSAYESPSVFEDFVVTLRRESLARSDADAALIATSVAIGGAGESSVAGPSRLPFVGLGEKFMAHRERRASDALTESSGVCSAGCCQATTVPNDSEEGSSYAREVAARGEKKWEPSTDTSRQEEEDRVAGGDVDEDEDEDEDEKGYVLLNAEDAQEDGGEARVESPQDLDCRIRKWLVAS